MSQTRPSSPVVPFDLPRQTSVGKGDPYGMCTRGFPLQPSAVWEEAHAPSTPRREKLPVFIQLETLPIACDHCSSRISQSKPDLTSALYSLLGWEQRKIMCSGLLWKSHPLLCICANQLTSPDLMPTLLIHKLFSFQPVSHSMPWRAQSKKQAYSSPSDQTALNSI
jgi:hypothetical protein